MVQNKRKRTHKGRNLATWIEKPFEQFSDYFLQEVHFETVTRRALQNTAGLEEVMEAVAEGQHLLSAEHRLPEEEMARSLTETRETAELARAEISSGYRRLHGHSLVAIWGALEVMVDDLVTTWLVKVPGAAAASSVGQMKFEVADFEGLEREELMRMIVRDIAKRKRSGEDRVGVNRFEAPLKAVSLDGRVSKEISGRLFELQQIRHVYVHRGGTADPSLIAACPKLRTKEGKPVSLSLRRYWRYASAAYRYAMLVEGRARQRYVDVVEE